MEIQSERFGHSRILSIEGPSVYHHDPKEVELYVKGYAKSENPDINMQFHSHFSDDSDQNASTTHAHMNILVHHLMHERKSLTPGGLMLDTTDECGKQYRCVTALYLLSVLASKFNIIIDRVVGAPYHGKIKIDGLNAVDKIFLRKKMCMIGTPECSHESTRMNAHAMVGKCELSFAAECLRLCSDKSRLSGVKSGGNKRLKRENETKMKNRFYHLQMKSDIHVMEGKTTVIGFCRKTKKSGIMHHHNFRFDPDLGIGKAAVRRIPCACEACLLKLTKPYDMKNPDGPQVRYEGSEKLYLVADIQRFK